MGSDVVGATKGFHGEGGHAAGLGGVVGQDPVNDGLRDQRNEIQQAGGEQHRDDGGGKPPSIAMHHIPESPEFHLVFRHQNIPLSGSGQHNRQV